MHNHSQAGNVLSKSLEMLSGIAAFVLSFVLTPPLASQSLPWAVHTFQGLYGPGIGDFILWGWVLIVGVTVFLTLRVALTLALITLNNWILMRI